VRKLGSVRLRLAPGVGCVPAVVQVGERVLEHLSAFRPYALQLQRLTVSAEGGQGRVPVARPRRRPVADLQAHRLGSPKDAFASRAPRGRAARASRCRRTADCQTLDAQRWLIAVRRLALMNRRRTAGRSGCSSSTQRLPGSWSPVAVRLIGRGACDHAELRSRHCAVLACGTTPIAAPESREVLAEIACLVYACDLVHVSSDGAAALERPAAPSAPYPRPPGVSTPLPNSKLSTGRSVSTPFNRGAGQVRS
jgi:hypothetical protein